MNPRAPITAGVVLCGVLSCWQARAEDDRLLATVNGHEVRMSQVMRQVRSMPLGDQVAIREQLDRFAESIVREEILFQSVLATDFAADPELRERIKAVVVQRVIERQVTERIQVSDADVRAFYDDNPDAMRAEEARASQILLADRDRCDELAASIDSDEAFAAAARAHSLDTESASRGGDLGLFMNHSGPYGFETWLFKMQPGEMAVFDSDDGCHLVRVTLRNRPPIPPFDEVRERIRAVLETRQERELLGELMRRAEASVTVERPLRTR